MRPRWLRYIFVAICFAMMGLNANALEPVSFKTIAGWTDDDFQKAFEPFRRSCRALLESSWAFDRHVRYGGQLNHWETVCAAADQSADPQAFFETQFRPFRVNDAVLGQGLFTGYFEPQFEGSLRPSPAFDVPIYRKPQDLVTFDASQKAIVGLDYGHFVDGLPQPYFSRKDIEDGALSGKGLEVAWVANWADAFFMHIQGAGRLHLQDGSVLRLGYAGKSGRPYTSIGGLLAQARIIPYERLSMQSIRHWMETNSDAARQLMWQNESFVFFRRLDLPEPELGPIGAGKVQLTPERSLAVDRNLWMFGTPVWLDMSVPAEGQSEPKVFRHLLIAQDTGSAIRGMARGDVFWGTGPAAAFTAGHMMSTGTMIVLLPIQLAADLGLPP